MKSNCGRKLQPVIQKEATGCAIASVAVLAGTSYVSVRKAAARMGIFASDGALWSNTDYVRRLLTHFGIKTGTRELRFVAWDKVPDRALLAIKWRENETGP